MVFYAVMFGAALIVGKARGVPLFFDPARSSVRLVWLGLVAGSAFGGVVALLTRKLHGRSRGLDELFGHFAKTIGPVGWREAFVLASTSAVAEEALFRGAIQPAIGLMWASIVFGLVHIPPRVSLVTWTAFALGVGFALGWLADRTGNLAGPIAAHFVMNLFNLELAGRVAKGAA